MCVIHHSHSFLILFFLNSTCPFPKEHPSSSHRIFQASKPSGTGKTLAYLIPAVEHLIKNPPPGVGVLILAPSRPSTTWRMIKWISGLNKKSQAPDTMPTWLYDKESLYLKNWNILEPESSINLLPSLHKESWCCKLPKMQRPSAATTLCKLFPSLVASEGTRTATANGLNSDTVILTDRRFPGKNPIWWGKKHCFPQIFPQIIPIALCNIIQKSSSFGGLCHSLKTSSPAKNKKLMVTQMASKGHHPKMVWHFSYLLNRFASPKL